MSFFATTQQFIKMTECDLLLMFSNCTLNFYSIYSIPTNYSRFHKISTKVHNFQAVPWVHWTWSRIFGDRLLLGCLHASYIKYFVRLHYILCFFGLCFFHEPTWVFFFVNFNVLLFNKIAEEASITR